VSALICEGCGRAPGAREVYCAACGRELPGRREDGGSDAAPPGWLVAAGAHGEGGYFEPMPTVAVTVPDGPGWRVRTSGRASAASAVAPPVPAAPARLPAPPAATTSSDSAGNAAAALVIPPRRAPLHLLYAPLLALVILSSTGAVALLALHVLLHR
jgi:hypothetical protein